MSLCTPRCYSRPHCANKTAVKPTPQSWLHWVLNHLVGWLAGDDNIQLVADLYQPTHSRPSSGTILIQCPYGRGLSMNINLRIWACYGYNILLVSTRSTYGSSGALDLVRTDATDGPRVVEWMHAQPWYTGTFVILGPSYLGFAQWALMNADPPPEDMVAAIISVGPQNFNELLWGTGALWLPLVDRARHMALPKTTSTLGKLWAVLDKTKVPILLISGCIPASAGARLHSGFDRRALEPHGGCQEQQRHIEGDLRLAGKALGQRTAGEHPASVRINVTGANEWRWLSIWPPSTKPLQLFLDPEGTLSWTQLRTPDKAHVNDSGLATRRDVLSFTSLPSTDDIEVLGKPSIVLSDTSHVDLLVRLSEVRAGGVSRSITEVYKRLDLVRAHTPGAAVRVELELSRLRGWVQERDADPGGSGGRVLPAAFVQFGVGRAAGDEDDAAAGGAWGALWWGGGVEACVAHGVRTYNGLCHVSASYAYFYSAFYRQCAR
ncbi:X-Pro dipeptidyl-peptidase-domain-containing protein [Mycena sanguinolenta]|nr:X-Pro dipeptidyl-peptidase-domain-containing protein [Mycena sanguinolenta]